MNVTVQQGVSGDELKGALFFEEEGFERLEDARWLAKATRTTSRNNHKPNKALHSDKIKLRSFLATLYFAGELGRYAKKHTGGFESKENEI